MKSMLKKKMSKKMLWCTITCYKKSLERSTLLFNYLEYYLLKETLMKDWNLDRKLKMNSNKKIKQTKIINSKLMCKLHFLLCVVPSRGLTSSFSLWRRKLQIIHQTVHLTFCLELAIKALHDLLQLSLSLSAMFL